MITLFVLEHSSSSYDDAYDFDLLEFSLEEENEYAPTQHPLLLFPFIEEWLPKFNNSDYILVNESLWLKAQW